jgi:hypothetical protein
MKNSNLNVEPTSESLPIGNNVLAVVLTEQLDKWIEECQSQADIFFKRNMIVSETSSLAMKIAYMNVKTFLENNR